MNTIHFIVYQKFPRNEITQSSFNFGIDIILLWIDIIQYHEHMIPSFKLTATIIMTKRKYPYIFGITQFCPIINIMLNRKFYKLLINRYILFYTLKYL